MKPIILTFTAFYLPGYRGGGPIRTIANMVDRLSDDFDFFIVTTDRDLGDSSPYSDIQVNAWNVVGKARVFYADKSYRTATSLFKILRETPHDILYLNSFFNPEFTLKPIFMRWLGLIEKRPIIIAPRGEFSKGALHIKAWKKRPFIILTRIGRFFSGITWHASTDEEAADIRRALPRIYKNISVARNVAVAHDLLENFVQAPDFQLTHNELNLRVLKVCFLSRIAAMKNLHFALEILAKVRIPVNFKIYGPNEDVAYWDKCQKLIDLLPKNIKVSYGGCVEHIDVKKVIGANDLFFVPSRGENFGHVFMESLAAGVPILVSDQTPWRNLKSQGLGWDIPLDQPENFVLAIEQAARLNSRERHALRKNCADFAVRKASDPAALNLNRALFLKALASADKSI